MGCPKNPKKFLGLISYEGPHDYELRSVTYTTYFTFQYECVRCGARRTQRAVQDAELVRMGYDLKKIRAYQGNDMRFTLSAEELEAFRETPG